EEPLASNGTYVEFILSEEDNPNNWGAKIVSSQAETITVDIFTPSTCLIAKWAFRVIVVKKENTDVSVYKYNHKNPIYILFNPWCKDDLVYLEDENLLNEYILNESGKIYTGSSTSISGRPWNFGQFETSMLDVAIYLVEESGLKWAARGNPIWIGRRLSAMVNAPDDGGVLEGRWDGEYGDGTSPMAWTGSVAILEEYWKTKRPVMYGQCWVFAGVATTVCRTLGIPARSVTNYSSAHDTDGSITVDHHLKANGEVDRSIKGDSVWNFHVWTEIWTARPDLPLGYGGWQVLDATPQERSDGIYICGPASVSAIKQGDVNLLYDGPFVFAEVNGDKLYWQPDERGVLQCVYVDKNEIGQHISTKAPNSYEREDLTLKYKYAEDTVEERAAVAKANLVGSTRRNVYTPTATDVQFSVEQDSSHTWVGDTFLVGLRVKNNSQQKRSVKGRISVSAMYYNGVMADQLKSEPKLQKVEVKPDEYDGHLKDECMLDVSILAQVKQTRQTFAKKEDFMLRKPHLIAKAPEEIAENEKFKLDVSFTNPLNVTLTLCSVTVDGIAARRIFKQENVLPKGKFATTLVVEPDKTGHGDIIIIFNSKQLLDINTSIPIFVREI
ncbi:unnamed protein product, partial [Candidula unifasciata]